MGVIGINLASIFKGKEHEKRILSGFRTTGVPLIEYCVHCKISILTISCIIGYII